MIIDLEQHFFAGGQKIKGKSESGRVIERYRDANGKIGIRVFEDADSVEKHLQFMDEAGIDIAVLTMNPELNLEDSRKWNDLFARFIKKNPKRFEGFASIPPLGGKPALEELERAVKDLELKGVHIFARSGGHTLDDKEYWPFYEKVSILKIPINIHVMGRPQGFEALHAPYPLYYIIAREFDICAATLRICLGGVLEDFPDLVFIMNHFGGGVSAFVERLDAYLNYVGPGWRDFYEGRPLITKPWREYFNKLYFSMAGREQGMETVKCALTNISPKKMMFATDWPFNYDNNPQGVREYVADIKKLDLPVEEIDGMLGGNAAKLLGIT